MSTVISAFLDQGLTQAGTRYDTGTPALLNQQVPNGSPEPPAFTVISNGLQPSPTISTQMHHFPDSIYDLRPESHITRLTSAILGDPCMGIISKMYTQARMSDYLLTTHFSDLDRMFGDVFGVHRFQAEALTFNPYVDQATPEAWADLFARDASYRNRIEQYARGINMGGTVQGMETVAEAILGCPVQIYETWTFVDQFSTSPGGLNAANIGANYYGSIEAQQEHYSDLERQTYADIEGGIGSYGRTTSSNRGEFIVRPMRAISLEENYQLIRVLTRLKPAEALLTISSEGVALHKRVTMRAVDADSTNWQVKRTVTPLPDKALAYAPIPATTPVFGAFQGTYWNSTDNIVSVEASALSNGDSHAVNSPGTYSVLQDANYGVNGIHQASGLYTYAVGTGHGNTFGIENLIFGRVNPSTGSVGGITRTFATTSGGVSSSPSSYYVGGEYSFFTAGYLHQGGDVLLYDYSADLESAGTSYTPAPYTYSADGVGYSPSYGYSEQRYITVNRFPKDAIAHVAQVDAGRMASSGIVSSPPYLANRVDSAKITSTFRESGM
jgi:hypothetical protein